LTSIAVRVTLTLKGEKTLTSKIRIQKHINLHTGWAALRRKMKREMPHGRRSFTFNSATPADKE